MVGFIYITTNNINGKKYLGRKMYKKGWETYLGSSKLLLKDIELYGKENFTREIVEECNSYTLLQEREVFYQKKYNVKADKSWYNITIACEGFDTSGSRYSYNHEQLNNIWPESRREKQRTRMLDKDVNPNYNTKVSKDRSDRMKINNPSFREDVKQKISNLKSKPFKVAFEGIVYHFKNNAEALSSMFGNAAIYVKKYKLKKNQPFKGLILVE